MHNSAVQSLSQPTRACCCYEKRSQGKLEGVLLRAPARRHSQTALGDAAVAAGAFCPRSVH